MARLPGLELAPQVGLPGLPQLTHEAVVLCHQPVFQLIQSVHRSQNLNRNLDRATKRFHVGRTLRRSAAQASGGAELLPANRACRAGFRRLKNLLAWHLRITHTLVTAKAAEDSRTPKPCGRSDAPKHAAASWSAAVLCRFSAYRELMQLVTSSTSCSRRQNP